MTIAFNCWELRNKKTDGIGNVIIQTLRPLIASHPEIKFLILVDKNFTEDYFNYPNASIHRIFPPYRHPALYVFYLELILPAFLKKHRPDLFVGLDGMISLRTKTKQLALIHDLNFEHYPKTLPLKNRLYYRCFFKKFAKKAQHIAAVSNYTKNDIVALYEVAPAKIDVITLGIKEIFEPLTESAINATTAKYTEGVPYFFFIGSMHARKNIQRLMLAFDSFRKTSKENIKLVLAGNIMWQAKEIKEVLENLQFKHDIIFTGRVSDQELKYLLGSAFCLCFVPLFEGFGLPIVEAFAAGVPVICSNTSSMPEIAGDAALLVDPYNINDIAAAMKKMMGSAALKANMIQKGNVRKYMFSWRKTADMLFEIIRKM